MKSLQIILFFLKKKSKSEAKLLWRAKSLIK